MAELSPAAQAVLDAYHRELPPDNKPGGLAAALRDAVLHAQPKAHIEDIDYVHQQYVDGWKDALGVIHDIVDELEGQSNG